MIHTSSAVQQLEDLVLHFARKDGMLEAHHSSTCSSHSSSCGFEKATRMKICNVTLGAAGNLLTYDKGGPYNLTLLPVQQNEVRGERASPDPFPQIWYSSRIRYLDI